MFANRKNWFDEWNGASWLFLADCLEKDFLGPNVPWILERIETYYKVIPKGQFCSLYLPWFWYRVFLNSPSQPLPPHPREWHLDWGNLVWIVYVQTCVQYLRIKMSLREDIHTKLPEYYPLVYGVFWQLIVSSHCYRSKLIKGVVQNTWSEAKRNVMCHYFHVGLVPLRFPLWPNFQ